MYILLYNYYVYLSVHWSLPMCLIINKLDVCSLSILPPNIEYHRLNKFTIV